MSPVSPRGLTIFIVDDDVDTTQSLHWLLELEGHVVQSANSAETCLELMDKVRPDVVLLDLKMPHITGFELHDRLRAHPNCQATKFIAYSGMGEAKTVKRAADEGFAGHLTKPSDHKDVLRLIEAILGTPVLHSGS